MRDRGGLVAGFDDVVCDDLVEGPDGGGEGGRGVAVGDEEGFYCGGVIGSRGGCAGEDAWFGAGHVGLLGVWWACGRAVALVDVEAEYVWDCARESGGEGEAGIEAMGKGRGRGKVKVKGKGSSHSCAGNCCPFWRNLIRGSVILSFFQRRPSYSSSHKQMPRPPSASSRSARSTG